MKKGTIYIVTVILALVLIIAEAYIIKSVTKIEPTIDAVFATRRIAEKTVITSDMVTLRKIDISSATNQTVRSVDNVVGKMATTEIENGEVIKSFRTIDLKDFKEITVLDKNNRLISVEFSPDQVNGWYIKVDNCVDIHYVPNSSTNKDNVTDSFERSLTKYQLYENIRVAGILDDKGQIIQEITADKLPKIISFEVTPELAKFLAVAKSTGKLEIALIQSDGDSVEAE